MGADSRGSGGAAYSPLSVVQTVLFADVLEYNNNNAIVAEEKSAQVIN
jgi:hypothetical protein